MLCGDVMTGRGVDQILPHPVEPWLREKYVDDARTYVDLAEKLKGPIARSSRLLLAVGDALPMMEDDDIRAGHGPLAVTDFLLAVLGALRLTRFRRPVRGHPTRVAPPAPHRACD